MNQSGELRQQIEDMALQLVVGEPENGANASAWLPALEKISAAAAREHAEPVAGAAAVFGEALRALLRTPADEPSKVSSVLREGVANLQKALAAPAQEIPAGDWSPAQDPELLSDFIVESREHLVNIESQVLTLEREPSDGEALNAVFRGFHTIKGLAGPHGCGSEVWSAACSTGEEVWTLAMILHEALPQRRVRITASDISNKALSFAQRAVYPVERCHGVPAAWLSRYFAAEGRPPVSYQIAPSLFGQMWCSAASISSNPTPGPTRFRSSSAAT